MKSPVYILDKALNETWTQEEIDHIVGYYRVEVQRLPSMPFRVVAMNRPLTNGNDPTYLTWHPQCMLREVSYADRWSSSILYKGEYRFDGMGGCRITDIISRMVALISGRRGWVSAKLNGVEVTVRHGDTVEERWAWTQAEMDRRRQEYLDSDEYKERQKTAEEAAKKCDRDRAAIETVAPKSMTLRDEETWNKAVAANQDDGYGAAVMSYAERWARYMEARLGQGSAIAECANECSHLADTEGITGFMYGCAVSILSQVWEHGEELRRWHNKDTQIGTEGDAANESGGVLNPAVLCIQAGE